MSKKYEVVLRSKFDEVQTVVIEASHLEAAQQLARSLFGHNSLWTLVSVIRQDENFATSNPQIKGYLRKDELNRWWWTLKEFPQVDCPYDPPTILAAHWATDRETAVEKLQAAISSRGLAVQT